MKQLLAITVGCAALLGVTVGCSSQDSDKSDSTPSSSSATASASASGPTAPPVTAAAPDQGKVTFGPNDAGPVTGIGCATENGLTTITVDGSQSTNAVITDEETPVVKSVAIGEIGSDQPGLAYTEGVNATPAAVARDGQKYTITGTGMGTAAADPMTPIDMPFEIAVTCP